VETGSGGRCTDPEERFVGLVSLACHDLRTPLATINGVAKMLIRQGDLGTSEAQLAVMIDGAAEEMASLLDQLGLAARITSGRYEPLLQDTDTLKLAASPDERVIVTGHGEAVSTDAGAVSGALAGLAAAALRHGRLATVTWTVTGRTLVLSPLPDGVSAVLEGPSARDLSALVARLVIESLGGRLELDGEMLRVELA